MRRIERLVNLIALLVDSPHPLSVRQILDRVSGYDGADSETSRRTFERDKQTVRDMGLDLQTVVLDGLSGPGPDNVGYVIEDAGDQIPDPGLSLSERGVLAVASSIVWEAPGPAAGESVSLEPEGAEADLAAHPLVELFLTAIVERRRVGVTYTSAGAQDSKQRRIDPYGLTHRRGRWYVAGLDSLSGELRAFRLDRMDAEVDLGGAAAFARPEGFKVSEIVPERDWEFVDGNPVKVQLAVDPRRLWAVEAEAGTSAGSETANIDGRDWPVLEIEVRSIDVFSGWALSLLDAAVVVDPPAVRDAVCEALAKMCGAGR